MTVLFSACPGGEGERVLVRGNRFGKRRPDPSHDGLADGGHGRGSGDGDEHQDQCARPPPRGHRDGDHRRNDAHADGSAEVGEPGEELSVSGGAEGDGLGQGGLVKAGDPVVFDHSVVDPRTGRRQPDDEREADRRGDVEH